ncbi:MAG TPA: hypothetical protein VEH04_10800 [Verrucomicrobiae bacterium]|nr:hypothetical protein [Verrucomicrobiae bacterium]
MKQRAIIGICLGVLVIGCYLAWRSTPATAPIEPSVVALENEKQIEKVEAAVPVIPADGSEPTAANLPQTQLLRDVLTAIEGVQSTADALEREARLAKAAAEVAVEDIPEVMAFLWNKEHISTHGDELRKRLLQRWAELDPKAAAEWVKNQPQDARQTDAMSRIAGIWSGQNFEEANAWAGALPEGDLRNEAQAHIAYEVATTSPMDAMQLAVAMPPGATRDDLLAHVASMWAAADSAGALAWTKQIEDVELRERLLVSVITAMGNATPAEAAKLALELLPQGRNQEDAVMSLIQVWAQREPETVAQWVASFSVGELQQTGVQNLVKIWADADMQRVGQWLNGLGEGAVRDAGICALIEKILPQDPKIAADWTRSISDVKLRQQEIENLGEVWLTINPAAAREFLEKAPITPEARQRLLQPPAPASA